MQKNETVIVKIEDIGVNGEGIGKVDGYTLFIKDTVIGDLAEVKVVKVKKNYGYARLMKVIVPSEYRTSPKCAFARKCGGCQIQEMSYEKQLEFKQNKVKGNLERIGGFSADYLEQTMEPIIGMEEPFYYRNKAQFPFGSDKKGNPVTGFYAGRTHDIIANTDCALGVPVNQEILELVLEFMKKYHISSYDEATGKGLIRHVLIRFGFATKEIMVCFVVNQDNVCIGKQNKKENANQTGRQKNERAGCREWIPHQEELIDRLRAIDGMASISISPNTKRNNVIMGDSYEVLWGKGYITDYIGEVKYQISPLSFYQVNPAQTEKLYGLALKYAGLQKQTDRKNEKDNDKKADEQTGRKTVVWDLYCGIGTISLFLAQQADWVYGVEIVPQAIDDAKQNAKINGIENVEFYVGKAEEVLPAYYDNYMKEHPGETAHADVIVVDPPRKGCEESLLRTIVDMEPDRVVYVSCDSATLARDLKYLCGRGEYKLVKWRAVDQFPMSVHVETVVMLSHKKPDSVINVKVEFGEGEGKVPLDNIAKRAEVYKPKERVTYKMIKEYIEAKYGFKVHTAYIAEVKRDLGLPMYDAPNAVEKLKQPRKHPTAEKVEAIKDALKYFEVIK